MITYLGIENFALIEKLSVKFSDGFSVITGETGAGKSILLGALGLVLGKRADLSSLKNKDEKCVIEAHFNIKNYGLQTFFDENDIDYDDDTIIRREILPSGKTRAFINDTPVNLNTLQDLSQVLVDIHSQHQTQELFSEGMQFRVIDKIAGHEDLIQNFSVQLKLFKKCHSELLDKQNRLHQNQKEQEYNAFILNELKEANLKTGEQEDLERIVEKLTHVEFIKESIGRSLQLVSDENFGILQNLKEIKSVFQKMTPISQEFQEMFERINSLLIECDDMERELIKIADSASSDPELLEKSSDKLQVIYSLQKKHQVATVDELLRIQQELDEKMISVSSLQEEIAALQESINIQNQKLDELAKIIHANRNKTVPILQNQLTDVLNKLGMENARFNILIEEKNEFFYNGKDEIEFLFSANKGSNFGLLKKIASGGELSRIMLAIKSIISQYLNLPTIIFDEIDTGVSGEIASKMADVMKNMSANIQVFAITHLPQIASKGAEHFKVFKVIHEHHTQSEIKVLNSEERVAEIAQMLSGSKISEAALMHAKELLN